MKTNAKRALSVGALLLGAGLGWVVLNRPVAAPPAAVQADPNYFAFVHSMEGTRPDGDLTVTAGDKLVVDAELGHLFDYYLAGLGEKDLAAIRAEIEKELDRRLKPVAAGQAKRLLGAYLDYKRELVDVEGRLGHPTDLAHAARARLVAMQAVRQKYFSAEEMNGLFGFSDAYDQDAITRIEISQDKQLNEAQRSARLAALDAKMPANLREERLAPTRVIRLEESVSAMRAKGATDDEVYRLRAQTLTPEAAARLADVDREEADWKARIAAYLAQRAKLQDPAQGIEQQSAALQQLRDAQFSAEEQRRLPAYE